MFQKLLMNCFIENFLEQHFINILLLLQYMSFLDRDKTSNINVYTMFSMTFLKCYPFTLSGTF